MPHVELSAKQGGPLWAWKAGCRYGPAAVSPLPYRYMLPGRVTVTEIR